MITTVHLEVGLWRTWEWCDIYIQPSTHLKTDHLRMTSSPWNLHVIISWAFGNRIRSLFELSWTSGNVETHQRMKTRQLKTETKSERIHKMTKISEQREDWVETKLPIDIQHSSGVLKLDSLSLLVKLKQAKSYVIQVLCEEFGNLPYSWKGSWIPG